jgi:hypothetical protein
MDGITTMRFIALLLTLLCFGISMQTELARASIYDSNVIQHLQLTGAQKQAMQKVVAESRVRRNRIFKKHGIDPNAKPQMSLLQRASSELLANASRERAAAKKILDAKQLQLYDALIQETRQRVMASF